MHGIQTQEEWETWLDNLRSVCKQTNIKLEYSVLQEIGQGSYSKVKLVQHIISGKLYASKIVDLNKINGNKRAMNALQSEIEILRSLQHIHVVDLHEIYTAQSKIYMIMDYAQHGDLYTNIMKEGVYAEKQAQRLIIRILQTVSYFHAQNVIHRDLKPENILMTDPEDRTQFKICDFGLACREFNQFNGGCGTPGYIAPEILKRKPFTLKSDIFAIGVITYNLLSAKSPFYSADPDETLVLNRQCRVEFPEKYWKNVSQNAKNFILKLMEPIPEFRYSIEEALNHP